ncbi:hypothetical protein V1278_003188 [Bradyrhizobium sp. AZCC 1577]
MSPAERKRAQRRRMRSAGQPSIQNFDRALREAVFASYQTGELSIDIPDLVQKVVEQLSVGDVTDRGCRTTVKALLAKAGAAAGGPASVQG